MVSPANGRDPLQPGHRGGMRNDEDAAFRRAVLAHRIDHPCHRRGLLPDRDIDADQVARFLIDDRVDRDRGLAGRAIADDQLALAAAECEQRIDDQDAGLHRLGDRVALDDGRRRLFDRFMRAGDDWRVHHPARAPTDRRRGRATLVRPAPAPRRRCRARCRRPRSSRLRRAEHSRSRRDPACGRIPNCPLSKRSNSFSRTRGSPAISAMPSPTDLTRPISSSSGAVGLRPPGRVPVQTSVRIQRHAARPGVIRRRYAPDRPASYCGSPACGVCSSTPAISAGSVRKTTARRSPSSRSSGHGIPSADVIQRFAVTISIGPPAAARCDGRCS